MSDNSSPVEVDLFKEIQEAFEDAENIHPYDKSGFLEVRPGVRVPTDDWMGYQMMANVFFQDVYDHDDLVRLRRALALCNQVTTERLEGKNIDLEEVQESLWQILYEKDAQDHQEKAVAIVYGITTTGAKKTEYMVQQSDGKDVVLTKYELKRKYPDTWQQMLHEFRSINEKTRETEKSDSPYSSSLEDELGNQRILANHRQEEEMHQGSTMMGSSGEKRFLAKKKLERGPESHGEGGLDKYQDDLIPKPASVYAEHNGEYRKRLSEPISVGRHRSLMYSPHVGRLTPNTEIPAKRYRPSMDQEEAPFVSPAQTDTAATAWTLLSKIMSNETRLISALEEEKARNAYLENLIMEGKGVITQNPALGSQHEIALRKDLEENMEKLKTTRLLLQNRTDDVATRMMQITELEEKLQAADKKIKTAEEECTVSHAKVQKAEEDFKKKLEEERKILSEKCENIERLNAQVLAKKQEEIHTAEEKLKTAEEKYTASQAKLQETLDDYKKKLGEEKKLHEEKVGEIERLQTRLAQKTLEVARITDAMVVAETGLKQSNEKCEHLETLLSETENRYKKEMAEDAEKQAKEIRRMADTLFKAHVDSKSEKERMQEKEENLKNKLKELKARFQEAMDAFASENHTLRTRIAAFSHDDVNALSVVDVAMRMQKEARNTLDILKRGESLEIASFYDNVEFDESDDFEHADAVKKWLHPSHWRNCKIVGAKKAEGVLQYKCMDLKTKETAYISSTDMQKRQFCLLPMLRYIESRSFSTTDTDTS